MARLIVALVLAAMLFVGASPSTVSSSTERGTGEEFISPYWGGAISQWSSWIVYWAEQRELDPDLVAAVIRKESIGQASAEGPYGAIGLMMVMSAEASGLAWRPTADQLKQPDVNLRWGTGMLKEIIRKADGDLMHALAAYNGGWNQVHLATTRRFAQNVLSYYAYAIAAHHGYSHHDSDKWSMVVMKRTQGHIEAIWTYTSGHFLAPCFEGALEFRNFYPDMTTAPRTRVTHYVDGEGRDVFVDAWLFVGAPPLPSGEALISVASPPPTRVGQLP